MKILKRELEEIKSLIESAKLNPTNSPNTTRLQVLIDFMTNIPLNTSPTLNDIYRINSYSLWAQSLSENTSYMIAPLIYDIENSNMEIYDRNFSEYRDLDKYGLSIRMKEFNGREIHEYLCQSTNPKKNIVPLPTTEFNSIDTFKSRGAVANSGNLILANILLNKNKIRHSMMNSFLFSPEVARIMDPREYNVLQLPTPKLNYYIQKNPFTVRATKDGPVLYSSVHIFPRTESQYDILVLEDKIVYVTEGDVTSNCTYKVFKLPELTILESGTDIKLNVYTKFGITRDKIVGPNVIAKTLPIINPNLLEACKVQHGFRIMNGELYDIYMNSVRTSTGRKLLYKRKLIDGEWVLTHY